MHFSIIPPGPNTSAMLAEGVNDAAALTEEVMLKTTCFPPDTLTQCSSERPSEKEPVSLD
jgi:hypothetical protein